MFSFVYPKENVEPVKQEVMKISQSKTIHPSTVEESLQNLELQSTKESVTGKHLRT